MKNILNQILGQRVHKTKVLFELLIFTENPQ